MIAKHYKTESEECLGRPISHFKLQVVFEPINLRSHCLNYFLLCEILPQI